MKLRTVITTILISATVAGTAYFVLTPSNNTLARRALQHVLDGEPQAAQQMIAKLPSSFPLFFYRGHLLQEEGKYSDSDQLLCLAITQARDESLLFDIFLSKATNAYFEGRDHDLSPLIEKARTLNSTHPFLQLFDGINAYAHGNFSEALQNWAAFECDDENTWLGPILKKRFPTEWLQLRLAHCYLECGDYLSARELLEKELHSLSCLDKQQLDLATLFLGLSYLKECEQSAFADRQSLHKVAQFYLDRGSCHNFFREKAHITAFLKNECIKLFQYEEFTNTGLAFVRLLQEWECDAALASIAYKLTDELIARRDLQLCSVLQKEFQGTFFYQSICRNLINEIEAQLKEANREAIFACWNLMEMLAPNNHMLTRHLVTVTTQELFHHIEQDAEHLPLTLAYLAFWQQLKPAEYHIDGVVNRLLAQGKLLWKREGQELKATRLMDLAIQLSEPSQRPANLRKIESYLTDLYLQAERSNMVHRLSLVYDAFDHFHFGVNDLVSPAKVANHLADAAYLFRSHNYASAQTHAQWVMKIDPKNLEALRLYGLASYQMGEFQRAFLALSQIPRPDQVTLRALILSNVFSSQPQDYHLAHMGRSEASE